jgi:hypothetical protein
MWSKKGGNTERAGICRAHTCIHTYTVKRVKAGGSAERAGISRAHTCIHAYMVKRVTEGQVLSAQASSLRIHTCIHTCIHTYTHRWSKESKTGGGNAERAGIELAHTYMHTHTYTHRWSKGSRKEEALSALGSV